MELSKDLDLHLGPHWVEVDEPDVFRRDDDDADDDAHVLAIRVENYYSAPRYDTSNEDGAPGYLAGFLKKAMEGRLQKPLEFGRNDKKVFEFLQGLPTSFKTILWRRAVWYNYIAKLQE